MSDDKADENEYLKCFRTLLHMMKIFGIFPFIFSHQGTSKRLFFSRVISLSVIVFYLSLLTQHLSYIGENIKLMTQNLEYDQFIRTLPTITIRCLHAVIPLIAWNKSKLMHVHWDNWKKFQNNLEKIKGIKYSSSVKSKVKWIPIISVSMLMTATAIGKPFYDKSVIIPPGYLPLLHAASLSTIIVYWYANCLYMKSVSREIVQLITQAMKSKRDKSICDLTALWLNLDELNKEFNATHSVLFLSCFSNAAFSAVSLLYSFLNFTTFGTNKVANLSYLVSAMTCIMVVALFCECADSLGKAMTTQVKEAILAQNMITTYGRPLRSIVIFLSLIEARKSKITFSGYMVVNRAATITSFSGMINYLIVLRQFDNRK